MTRPRIAVVVSGFPRYSETFALNELLAIQAHGMLAGLFATKSGDGRPTQPGTERLFDVLHMLPPEGPEGQAEFLSERAAAIGANAVHAYFAHLPLQVAARAALRMGVPYGLSVHARDARKAEPAELRRQVRGAACTIACNRDVAAELRGCGAQVQLIPHGVSLERFTPSPLPDGEPLRLLAVGRLVEKKGFEILLRALAEVGFDYRLRIVGSGPGRDSLAANLRAYGLQDRVELHDMETHEELPTQYRQAHAVIVPSIVDRTGDRDGLPNVVLEAMATGRPVIASDVGDMRSAVIPGKTGWLVPPGDHRALAEALVQLASQSAQRAEFGAAARALIVGERSLQTCTDRLCQFLEVRYA